MTQGQEMKIQFLRKKIKKLENKNAELQEKQTQHVLSPGGSDELDPIIKEIQQGKYRELHIQLKTKDGIKFKFDYPVGD